MRVPTNKSLICRRLLTAALLVVGFAPGCTENVEQADPEAIRRFEELDARTPRSSSTRVTSASPSGSRQAESVDAARPSATSSATPSPATGPIRTGRSGLSTRLVDEAQAILEELPANYGNTRLFAYASWFLDRTDKRQTADILFDKAKRCVDDDRDAAERSYGTSVLIAACRGGGHDADFATLQLDSDRLFDALARNSHSLMDGELAAEEAHRRFLRALVLAGRYEDALTRLSALKSPAMRYRLAEAIVRFLAGRERESDVLHCAEIMKQAAEMQASLKTAERRRTLMSAYALADVTEAAEKISQALPPPMLFIEKNTVSSSEFLPIVDLAAALHRRGDTAGCDRLIASKLEPLKTSDLPALITAWVQCDEFERAAELARLEPDSTMKPRLATLLCRAIGERGRGDEARKWAAEFERFPYAAVPQVPESRAAQFDARFSRFGLSTVVPLLTGDESTFFERLEPLRGAQRCDVLLRSASLLWALEHPDSGSFVPYEDDSLASTVFGEKYRRYPIDSDTDAPKKQP